jgi:hypothetical protein
MKCHECKSEAVEGKSRCAFHLEKTRAYYQRPEVKEKTRAYKRAYYQRPEVKEKTRAYMRAYFQRPEVKEKTREMRAERDYSRKIIGEYHHLMKRKKLSVRQMRRLEALAEILGRDIDEWRNEAQRKEYQELIELGCIYRQEAARKAARKKVKGGMKDD